MAVPDSFGVPPSGGPGPRKRGTPNFKDLIAEATVTESDAEAIALQTLPREVRTPEGAKRLDCGAFTAAFFVQPKVRLFHKRGLF